MPERMADPGLELGGLDFYWDPDGYGFPYPAAALGVTAHGGDMLPFLLSVAEGFPVSYKGAWTVVDLPAAVPGEPLELSAWVRDWQHDVRSTTFQVEAELDPGTGMWDSSTISPPVSLTVDWEQALCGIVQAGAGPNRVRFRLVWSQGSAYPVQALWDDFSAMATEDVTMQSRWLAHQALVTRLKLLDGVNYRLNLGNRVFPRLFVPGDEAVSLLPYLCVPLYGDLPRYEDQGTYVMMRWRVNGHGYVHEEAMAYDSTTSVRDCYYGVEDVLKVILADRTLNGTVRDVVVLAHRPAT